MVASSSYSEPERSKLPEAATTTAEAKAKKSPYLCLSSLKLTQLPDGISKLSSLTNLDISNNKIQTIPEGGLPPNLVELTLTGCELTELPECIATLPSLKKLFAGANRLQAVDAAFRSPSLQHVGLSYNRIAVLPPAEVLGACRVVSLDLAHNDLEGLTSTLTQLALLPSLGALSLAGNPLALAPRYTAEAKGRLKQLLFLDGQRLEQPAGSRPGTANSASLSRNQSHVATQNGAPAAAEPPHRSTGGGAASPGPGPRGTSSSGHGHGHGPRGTSSSGHGRGMSQTGGPLALNASVRSLGNTANSAFFSTHQTVRFEEGDGEGGGEAAALTLTLRGLRPAEEPFAAVKARWAEQIAIAEELGMTTPPTLDMPDPPLQPVIYHVEMTDVEGTAMACIPLRILPPTPPDLAVMFDPKAKAAAAAAAAKEAAREAREAKKASKPGSSQGRSRGKSAVPPTPEPGASAPKPLELGLLRVTLPLRACTEHRNWLRSGTTVSLYQTTLTATVRAAADSAAGGEGHEAGSRATTPTGGSKPAAAGGRKKKNDEPPPVEYDISSRTELLGTAVLRVGANLLDGVSHVASERLEFVPPPPLFDDRGIRLALKDPQHPKRPVGSVEARMVLHVPGAAAGGQSASGWEG